VDWQKKIEDRKRHNKPEGHMTGRGNERDVEARKKQIIEAYRTREERGKEAGERLKED